MPRIIELNQAELENRFVAKTKKPTGSRAALHALYDELVKGSAIALDEGENAQGARLNLTAAAKRLGKGIEFARMGKDRIIAFRLVDLPAESEVASEVASEKKVCKPRGKKTE